MRFLGDGRTLVATDQLQQVLSELVDIVVARLDQEGVQATPLHREWDELKRLDENEVQFCEAAARLGLDPWSLPESVSDLIIRADAELETALLDDFLDAASRDKLQDDLAWVGEATVLVRHSGAETEPLPQVSVGLPAYQHPWQQGLQGARLLRTELGLPDTVPVDPRRWVGVEKTERVDRSLEGLGGRSIATSTVVALSGPRSPESERFAVARSLWRSLRSGERGMFLITSARTPVQQAERAFAAEFLAPSTGLEQLVPPGDDLVDPDQVTALSSLFGVNERVIEYQIINQLHRDVDDPSLVRDTDY